MLGSRATCARKSNIRLLVGIRFSYELTSSVASNTYPSPRFDPAKFIMEHYVDGDLVNCDTEIAKSKIGKEGLFVWGPDVPDGFLS